MCFVAEQLFDLTAAIMQPSFTWLVSATIGVLVAAPLAAAAPANHYCPHCQKGRPVPPPTPRPYESLGSIDVSARFKCLCHVPVGLLLH